jgi:hypothetical protein
MSTSLLVVYNGTVQKVDSAASGSTVPIRDSSGGVTHNSVTTGSETASSLNWTVASKTATYSLGTTETTVLCNATGGAFTVTLPAVAGLNGRRYEVVKTDSSGNAITVNCADAATINGSATTTVATQYTGKRFVTDGTNWFAY